MSANNVPWISSISFGVMQDTGVQRDLEMYSQGNFDYTISDKKLNLAKCIIPISYMYRYGFFQLINSFFIIKFQYTVKQIMPKKTHKKSCFIQIKSLKKMHSPNSVWSWAWA